MVAGETHYKAILEAARVRNGSYEEGRRVGLSEWAANLGGNKPGPLPRLHRFMGHVHQAEN